MHSWEMRDLLIDLHKTDALMQVYCITDQETKNIYYAQVLAKHEVTQAEFDSSLVWYTAHPQLFDKIYPKVVAQLEKEKTQFIELHPEFATTLPADITNQDSIQVTAIFRHSDLDSIIWTIENGPCHSWNEWQRPYSLRIDE